MSGGDNKTMPISSWLIRNGAVIELKDSRGEKSIDSKLFLIQNQHTSCGSTFSRVSSLLLYVVLPVLVARETTYF